MSNQNFYRGALTSEYDLKQADKTAKASERETTRGNLKDKGRQEKNGKKGKKQVKKTTLHDSSHLKDMVGKKVMLIMEGGNLFFKDEHFEPVFSGKLVEAANGYITLSDTKIKRKDNTVYKFPSPVSFSVEKISRFLPLEEQKSERGRRQAKAKNNTK